MDLKKRVEECKFAFLDVETTGLSPDLGDAVCEIGVLKTEGARPLSQFQRLVNPKKSIPYGAYAVHKICDEEVKNAPFFEEIAPSLVDFIKDCVICAYNAEFDLSFINAELKRINYPQVTLPAIDILAIARANLNLTKYNLNSAALFFNLKNKRRHRALEDATVAYEVFFKLKDILKEKGVATVEEYLSLYGLNYEKKNRIV